MPVTKSRLVLVLLIVAYSACYTNGDQEAFDLTEDLSVDTEEEIVSSEEVSPPRDDHDIVYNTPNLDAESLPYFLYEHFDDELAFNGQWTQSKATKAESEEFVYDGEWSLSPSHSRLKGLFCY